MRLRGLLPVLLALHLGCGPSAISTGTIRGRSPETRVFTPPERRPVVDVSDAQFREAMAWLAADMRAQAEPLSSPRVRLATFELSPGGGNPLARDYQGWCLRRHGPPDCLSLLGARSFGSEGKRRLALSIAMGAVMGGAADAVGEFMDPFKLEAMVMASVGTYLLLLYLPEPVSKGVVTLLTITLYGYLGSELWNVVTSYMRMQEEADAATSFVQVQAAGERFGNAIGERAARILIMVVTARLGAKAETAAKLRGLPGYAQASTLFAFPRGPALAGAAARSEAVPLASIASQASAVVLAQGRLNVFMAASSAVATAPGPGQAGAATTVNDARAAVRRRVEELLKPDNQWIGEPGTSSRDVRILTGKGLGDAEQLFQQLAAGGTKVTRTSYPGTLFEFPSGGTVGLRPVSRSGPPTIDLDIPGMKVREIKFVP